MEIQYKTQCPHCATQFKLSESQLAQAGGMVRCGKCLKPFQATDYLVDTPRKAPPAAVAPTRQTAPAAAPRQGKPVAKPTSEEQWAKQLLESEGLASGESAPPPKPAKNTSRWQMPQEAPARRNDEDTLSLGDAIEINDELENIQAGGFTDFNADDFGNLAGAGRRKQSDASDEDWARQLLEEDNKPAAPQTKADKAPATARKRPAITKPQSTPPASLFDFDEGELDLGPLGADNHNNRYEQAMAQVGHDRTSYFIKWTSLSLLLLCVLGGQYLVFNFQSLARAPDFRPFYAQACQLLGCELPSNVNIDMLQATNLLVRSMDDQPGALLVDLLLHNQADHAQPFPNLQLTFSGLQDQLMAVGVFNPADYLQNSLAGMKNLPPQAQVHLSFRITDPGPDAKNYSLKLLPPPHA